MNNRVEWENSTLDEIYTTAPIDKILPSLIKTNISLQISKGFDILAENIFTESPFKKLLVEVTNGP